MGACRPQLYVYSRCIANYASQHRWMAFIDADEFFVIKDGTPDLPVLLREYEDFGGLAVNWQVRLTYLTSCSAWRAGAGS